MWQLACAVVGSKEISSRYPLLPAPNSAGEATVRPLSTKEFSTWIRMILGNAELLGPDAKLSSHSCKATLLSFLAKYGASIPDRETLGGHTSRLKSVITYSRDSVASPLRTLPDSTRSGLFVSEAKQETITVEDDVEPLALPCQDLDKSQCEVDAAAGEDDDLCSDTSSDSEEEAATESHAARLVQAPKAPAGTQLRQHPKSKMLHLLRDEDRNLLMCGRRIAESFTGEQLAAFGVVAMALIDSEKAFQKRCDELHDGLFDKMKGQNITSFSTFAFSVGSPQNPVSDSDFAQLTDSIFEGQTTLGTTAILRRLHFEACTLLVADMKTQSASVDASEPVRKLPYVEKTSRLEAQKKKLTGLLHSPEQQPSHSLIDSVFSMMESGSLTYVHPSKCHSREHEIQAEAKSRSKTMLTIEQGSLKQTVVSSLTDIDTGTELKLYFAMQRRHLAFDLVGLLSWERCQKWLDKLMSSLVSDAPQHFTPISLTQIMRADREVFSLMASEHKESLKAAPGAKPPLDETFEKLMHDPRINVHLIAMPKIASPSAQAESSDGSFGAEPMTDGVSELACQLDSSTVFPANLTAEASCEPSDEQTGTGLVLEVFAGTCRFSKACRDAGLRSLAIDKDPKRSENFPVANFDLTKPHDYETVCKLVEAEQSHLVAAHFAPSCGTASRAREKRVPGVANPPRPLRGESYPDGLPNLSDQEQQRINEANASYSAMAQLIILLVNLGVAVSVENPLNSLFWLTSFIVKLMQQIQGHSTVLQHCMHGGKRDKKSKFWSFNPRNPDHNLLQSMGLLCDGSHTHQSWKPRWVDGKLVFPTAEEAAYPELLCKRLASIYLDEARARGLAPVQTLRQQLHVHETVGKRNIFTMQARGNKLKPLVTEWGSECRVIAPVLANSDMSILKQFPKGVFETCVRPPVNSLAQLQGMAKGLNMAVVTSLQNSEWQSIDETAWLETLAEVEKGWLGIEDSPDLDNQHVAKRFPIVQKGKTRLIDDFSVNGINSTYGMGEKLRIDSIDEVMACLSILLDGDQEGQKPAGVLGRTFDLKAAYKQFGVDSEHAQKLRIAVKRPGGGVGYFKVFALPFGATGSVASFLRLAASISFIGLKGLALPWTSFFDDFTMLTPTGTESDAEFFAEGLFKLLGLDYAAEGTKAPPFSDEFRTLGLLVKTSSFSQGRVELGHTPERREELLELLASLQQLETVTVKQLEQIHGRIVWFRSFVFGRQLNSATKVLSWYARRPTKMVQLDKKLLGALSALEKHLKLSTNVVVTRDLNKTWLIFTDGAFEPDQQQPASIGGVLIHPQGKVVSFFGAFLNETLTSEFLAESKHPIYELEIFPLVVAVRAWSHFIKDQLVVHYLDNDAARSSFVRGDAGTRLGCALVDSYLDQEFKCRFAPWFARVASGSNPADSPSRLELDEPWLVGVEQYPLVLPTHLSQWGIFGWVI
eukprot:s340_g4.t1